MFCVTETLVPRVYDPVSILGIDVENMPDWYGGGDFVYGRTVCVSWKWVGSETVDTVLIDWRDSDHAILGVLHGLRAAIEEADVFLGHNFQHDRKELQALFAYLKEPLLLNQVHIDTMRCIPSGPPRSLEYLCGFYNLGEKPHLTNHDWTLALTRWDPYALQAVMDRCEADVRLTERLYYKEIELGYLKGEA